MSKLKYILSALLSLLLIFSLSGCGSVPVSKKISISDKDIVPAVKMTDDTLYFSDAPKKALKKISSSGILEMYLDEKTLAVCIRDTISGKMWRSLPEAQSKATAANLIANVIIKGREYSLNSQRDSLSQDCASYNSDNGSLTISYSFRRILENGKKVDITIPLEFNLIDGNLNARVDCKKIEDKSNIDVYIRSVEILPYFAAQNERTKGDYILLPSASGIILDTDTKTEKAPEITLPVYGEDIAKNSLPDSFVPVGAFGMKRAENAFICLIDEGEAIATIKAQKADKSTPLNRVGAEFEITPAFTDDGAIYISNKSYSGILSLSYRFLSSDNADYMTMAGALRELLIRQSKLTDGNLVKSSAYPFNLSLTANDKSQGISTTREQIQELLTALITKGIGNINVILKDDGTLSLAKLTDFTKKNNLSLSLSKNLFSYKGKPLKTLSGEENALGLAINKTDETAEDIIRTMRKNSVGVALGDCGHILPSSYDMMSSIARTDMLREISDICTSVSSHGPLTVSAGNIYTLRYACNIINIPEKSPLEELEYCSPVPFIQGVLHGICDYSFTPVNLSDDPTKAMLKAIEYGAVPHYEWHFASYSENDPLHYMNSLSQARLLYENMKNVFGDLRDQRITAHETLRENLSRTVYSQGTEIYVNYNNEAVTFGGITVDPMSFLRIN